MSIAWILTPAVSTIPFLAAIVRKSVAVFAKTVTSIWLLGALLLPMSALCAESKIKITEEQAVKIAETYVADHGFTRINPRAETVSSTESMPATAQSQVNSAANELPPLIPCEISLNSRDFLVAFKHIVDPVGQRLKVVMDEFGDVVQVQNPTVEHTNTTQLMTKAKTNRVIIYVADCMGSNNQATKSNNFEREADKDFDYS